MKVRILTGAMILVVGLPVLIFSEYIIYPIALAMLCTMSAFELLRVFGLHKKWAVSIPSYLISFVLPLLTYDGIISQENQKTYLLAVALTLYAFLLYLALLSICMKGTLGLKNMSIVYMTVTYIVIAFTSMGILRYMENGAFVFGITFIAAWICDVMAYFSGVLFGKHKLIPSLSPKKTVEGSIGGTLFSVVAILLYGLIVEVTTDLTANYFVLGFGGLLLAIVSQLGDLFASLIKREYGVKDYSNLLPGHGGIMDRFDSILAVSTVLMIISNIFPPFA